jgi:hypothetical protein
MERTDRPMSLFMKVVFWFVAVNALVGLLMYWLQRKAVARSSSVA